MLTVGQRVWFRPWGQDWEQFTVMGGRGYYYDLHQELTDDGGGGNIDEVARDKIHTEEEHAAWTLAL